MSFKKYDISTLDLRIGLPSDNLSIPELRSLNNYQDQAVKKSLRGRFTLIQGPPGEVMFDV